MSKVNATYGVTQSPLVISTAGSVGVEFGVGVGVEDGAARVALGEGVGVDICLFDIQATKAIVLKRNR